MSYTLNLSSAWAKLKRGKTHIDSLKIEIEKVYANGSPITLRREYEPKNRAIVIRIESVVDIPDHWSLVVGDAVHNIRCALDHLAWQLALRHFDGIEPTNRAVIKSIHFPVVIEESKWRDSVHNQWMDGADANKLKRFQPFNLGPQSRAKGVRHPFEIFCGFDGIDNIDKHRSIHLTYIAPRLKSFASESVYTFHECYPVDGSVEIGMSGFPTNPGDEVARVSVVPSGPDPDVDFETCLAGYVAMGERWDVIKALDAFADGTEQVLRLF